MRLLAIGCFHGKFPKGLKRYVRANGIDAVLALGDFPGERLRSYEQSFVLMRKNEYSFYVFQEATASSKRFKKLKKLDGEDGVKILKRLDSLGIPVFVIHGNHDETRRDPWFAGGSMLLEDVVRKLKNMTYLDYAKSNVGGYDLVFLGCKYPNMRGDERGSARKKKLRVRKEERSKLVKLIMDPRKTIIVAHQPPYMTKLDRVNDKRVPGYGHHFGDDVLRLVIEKKKPALVLCAHFHENQGTQKIGKTLVVCTGYGAKGQAAVIELKKRLHVKLVRVR